MDEKKARIIAAAEQMFAHFGIQKTTMEEIAKKVHMGKSTLYYYFKSKEDIFAEYQKNINSFLESKKKHIFTVDFFANEIIKHVKKDLSKN